MSRKKWHYFHLMYLNKSIMHCILGQYDGRLNNVNCAEIIDEQNQCKYVLIVVNILYDVINTIENYVWKGFKIKLENQENSKQILNIEKMFLSIFIKNSLNVTV